MKVEMEGYIVIIISSVVTSENSFLLNAGRNDNEIWCYAAKGKNDEKICSKLTDNDVAVGTCSVFLINPDCWKCNDPHFANCRCADEQTPSTKIIDLLIKIKSLPKKVIIWSHIGDNIACQEIASQFRSDQIAFCDSFHHQNEQHSVEAFMKNLCSPGNNFITVLSKFINESLAKKSTPHLIALSILCQGYLAAHAPNKINFPSNVLSLKKEVIKSDWWQPSFGDKDTSGTPVLFQEMSALKKDTSCVKKLFDASNSDNVNAAIVFDALESIKFQKLCVL